MNSKNFSGSLSAGTVLRSLPKGRLTSSHIVRWCAAQNNWAKIHYDESYARDVAHLPGPLINGALKQHFLVQFLEEAFDAQGWTWRIDYRFNGMDLVGQQLEVRGKIAQLQELNDHIFVNVECEIHNLDIGESTTIGTGIVVFHNSGSGPFSALELQLPDAFRLNEAVSDVEEQLPEQVRAALGSQLAIIESAYSLDLSRLRLFSDAVMGMDPIYYDPVRGANSFHSSVVAPPLFPLHALDMVPGEYPLRCDPFASGREGVAELPGDLASRFGLKATASLNGGSQIEVHSLLRAGECVVADSTLVGAKYRVSRRGQAMLIFETLNRYREGGGRPLLSERHVSVYSL